LKEGARPATLIGVDLGGTIVRVGVLDASQAQLLAFNQAPIEATQGPEAGVSRISTLIEKTLAESGRERLDGIGIGVTGPVDSQRGLIQNPYTLPGWENVDIRSPLSQRFGVPVILENDADVAALGEYWSGAGQNVRRLYAITVGTGIGTAFIQDGAIYRGLGGAHPDGGHQVVDPAGPPCYCGARGCWESLASGPAIARLAQEQITEHPSSSLLALAGGEAGRIDARLVAEAARQGDSLALSVMENAARYFSLGLVNVVTLFVPEVIVLSGGVMNSISFFMPAIERALAEHDVMVPARKVRVVSAQLGYLAGTVGAAYAALQTLKE
jgi:glucokinase